MKTNASLRPLRRGLPLLALALGLSLALAPAARAQSIGVNFQGYQPTAVDTLAATDVAGAPGFAQANYNNVNTSSATGLRNSLGLATTAGFSLSVGIAGNFYFRDYVPAASGSDERFMNGQVFYDTAGSNRPATLSLTNIPFASYSLVVYTLGEGNSQPLSFTVGATSYYTDLSRTDLGAPGYLDNNPATPFTYTQITSTSASAPTANGDYAVFTGLSGASQNLILGYGQFDGQTALSGFEIINTGPVVPEPGTWAGGLLMGGLALLGVRRRAYRRVA